MNRRLAIAACLALACVPIAGCGDDDESGGSASTTTTATQQTATQQEALPAVVEVSIGDNFYKPKSLTIKRGQSIKWKNDGAVPHTVTSEDDSTVKFDSGSLDPRGVYALKPTTAGKLTYFCTVHGTSQSGTVTVER